MGSGLAYKACAMLMLYAGGSTIVPFWLAGTYAGRPLGYRRVLLLLAFFCFS